MRVAVSQSSVHSGQWLSMAFKIACRLEQSMRTHHEPPLLHSPLGMEDEAFLRLHFCMQTEIALTSARRGGGGLWSSDNLLVLVSWISVDTDTGVAVFARSLTKHTPACLVDPDWEHVVQRRGDDSVVECARAFERALHLRNVQTTSTLMPALSKHPRRRYRSATASLVAGESLFDSVQIPDLDTATTLALERVRAAQADETQHDSLKLVQTNFKDGVAAAVVGVPLGACHQRNSVDANSTLVARSWNLDRSALLKRIAQFRD